MPSVLVIVVTATTVIATCCILYHMRPLFEAGKEDCAFHCIAVYGIIMLLAGFAIGVITRDMRNKRSNDPKVVVVVGERGQTTEGKDDDGAGGNGAYV